MPPEAILTDFPATVALGNVKGNDAPRRSVSLLGMRVDELDYETASSQICRWAERGESRYMCVSTVHMVMESYDDAEFGAIVNGADLVCSDGVPVMWVSRWLGLGSQTRVFGPELTLRTCAAAEARGIPVGFYGSTQSVIDGLKRNMQVRFPRLKIAYAVSPPFRKLTDAENDAISDEINASGARIIFVGLGCPKQERWMLQARPKVKAVMLGVGWAFDIWSGQSQAAPEWIQKIGMEWLFRLIENPKKLWKRHLKNNPRFVVLAILQVMGIIRFKVDKQACGA